MKRKTDNFSKFINRKSTGAVKEEIRQEKKLIKKERREAVDRHFEEKRNKRAAASSLKGGGHCSNRRDRKNYCRTQSGGTSSRGYSSVE